MSVLKMKNLTESLEKKYKLDEAFDESMPKWLKQAIAISAERGQAVGHVTEHRYDYRTKKMEPFDKYVDTKNQGSGWGRTPTITAQRNKSKYAGANIDARFFQGHYGDEEWDFELGLAAQFLKKGIDISKVKVYEAPIPDHVPRITKNQQIIPIFLFDNGQVWAKGINDLEKPMWGDYGSNPYVAKKEKPFKLQPGKDIIEHTVAYAYMDLSDEAIKGEPVTKKREQREQLFKELLDIPNYVKLQSYETKWNIDSHDVWDKLSGRSSKVELSRYADKSGYSNEYNAERYRKKAQELKRNRILKDVLGNADNRIMEVATEIDTYKNVLITMLEDADVSDPSFGEVAEKVSMSLSRMRSVCDSYENMCWDLNEVAITDDLDKKRERAEKFNSDYLDATRYLDYIKSQVGSERTVSVDW